MWKQKCTRLTYPKFSLYLTLKSQNLPYTKELDPDILDGKQKMYFVEVSVGVGCLSSVTYEQDSPYFLLASNMTGKWKMSQIWSSPHTSRNLNKTLILYKYIHLFCTSRCYQMTKSKTELINLIQVSPPRLPTLCARPETCQGSAVTGGAGIIIFCHLIKYWLDTPVYRIPAWSTKWQWHLTLHENLLPVCY